MAQSFFIWNGVDCRSMGIYLSTAAPIVRPEERVVHHEIPGRSGDLTTTEGTDQEPIYNSYIQTVTIHVRGAMNVRRVYEWLRGSGYVTFSGEPDRRQQARIIGAISLQKAGRNLDIWVGQVQFYCQPLKELLWEVKNTLTGTGVVANMGSVPAKPRWKITVSEPHVILQVARAWGSSTSMEVLHIDGTTAGSVLIVDSDLQMITDELMTTNWTGQSSGDFPILMPGSNVVGGAGWSSIEIEKRERYL